MKTARELVNELDDPDYVGAAEYRAIHTLLDDAADDNADDEPEDQLMLMVSILEEVEEYAAALKKRVRNEMK